MRDSVCVEGSRRESPHIGLHEEQHIVVINHCYTCIRDVETVDLLLLHALWKAVFSLSRMRWVMSRWVVDPFLCWKVDRAAFTVRFYGTCLVLICYCVVFGRSGTIGV